MIEYQDALSWYGGGCQGEDGVVGIFNDEVDFACATNIQSPFRSLLFRSIDPDVLHIALGELFIFPVARLPHGEASL